MQNGLALPIDRHRHWDSFGSHSSCFNLSCAAANALSVHSLSSSRKTGRYASAQSKSKEETDALLYQESLAWSLFLNNIIFVAAFLFLAFYVLRSVETL